MGDKKEKHTYKDNSYRGDDDRKKTKGKYYIKEGKPTLHGKPLGRGQSPVHEEKMEAYLGGYDSMLRDKNRQINRISDDDPKADEKEARLRARKEVIQRMRDQQESYTKK